jgi:hypothetical protein
MFYAVGAGMTSSSPWSSEAWTYSYSPPVVIESAIDIISTDHNELPYIQFSEPKDDGGKDILGYSVFVFYLDDWMSRKWIPLSTYTLGTVSYSLMVMFMHSLTHILCIEVTSS